MTVEHEQFLGVLLKKATLSVDRRLQGCISYNAALKAPSVPSGRSARIPFAAGSGHRSQCSRRAPARAQDLRHDLAASPPMKRHGWGLDAHGVADVIFRRVDDQLMRRAGNTHRRCTAERRLMETVNVAADDSRNLGMRSNDAGELVTATKAMRVNRTDAHLKRRMVLAIKVAVVGARASVRSSHASWAASSSPPGARPRRVVSSATSRTGRDSIV